MGEFNAHPDPSETNRRIHLTFFCSHDAMVVLTRPLFDGFITIELRKIEQAVLKFPLVRLQGIKLIEAEQYTRGGRRLNQASEYKKLGMIVEKS
jgi:hypothetical protein